MEKKSDHPFGISWINKTKLLGYHFGSNLNLDDICNKLFIKFTNVLNLWNARKLSYKGKSTVLNSVAISKFLYYVTCGIMPKHYITLFQKACFKFIWGSSAEPVNRNTLYLPFKSGGLNVPNIQLKCESQYLAHTYKIINNHEAVWTYFAKYWIRITLRKHNASLFSNNTPHNDNVPAFYQQCLKSYKKVLQKYPDFVFKKVKTKDFYNILLSLEDAKVRVLDIFPQIDFKQVFNNLYSPSVNLDTRNTCWRICHDSIYVNYYLNKYHINKNNKCTFCKHVETISHLFIECKIVNPLNRIVLKFLRLLSDNKIVLSEKVFRFLLLPKLPQSDLNLALLFLTESRQVIWECRNLCKYNNKLFTDYALVAKFLSRIRFRMQVDLQRMDCASFGNIWSVHFCTINVDNREIIFDNILDIKTYFKKM